MTSAPIRQIIVDDADTRLNYKGKWKVDASPLDNIGFYGPIFNKTSHGASEDASVQFTFTGTSISVFGTNQTIFSPVTSQSLTWECLIDDVRVAQSPPPPELDNNWNLCEAIGMSEGSHTIVLNVVSAGTGGTLWVDYLRYTPLADATFADGDVTIHVPSADPGIKYSAGWNTFGAYINAELSHYSKALNANVEFSFVGKNFLGTKLEWSGWYLKTFKHNPASATYTIDGSLPKSFDLGNTPDTNVTLTNNIFFTTPDLAPGRHTLVVTYNGGPGDAPTPLSLGYLLVTGSSISAAHDQPQPAGSTTSSPSSLPSFPASTGSSIPAASSASSVAQPTPVGAIVGGVVGGLTIIALAIIAFILIRRTRAQSRRQQKREPPTFEPFLLTSMPPPPSTVSSKIEGSSSDPETLMLTPMSPSPAPVIFSSNGLPPYSLHA
ncbi:hypothetical protein DXG01_010029 [Tephrocybe rancida]|nr:hypothetical protein DXG01_010029 [Tephrocybe rancida]